MSSETNLPPRAETPGRRQGSGVWLERKTVDAYERWGYDAARGGLVWGQEIDVISVYGSGTRRITQCKDWQDKPVTPATIWRLIALAYSISARPTLVTTTELTEPARKIARRWKVAVLTPKRLEQPIVDPIAGEYLGDPDPEDRRWTGRLDDGGWARELLLRNVPDIHELRTMY